MSLKFRHKVFLHKGKSMHSNEIVLASLPEWRHLSGLDSIHSWIEIRARFFSTAELVFWRRFRARPSSKASALSPMMNGLQSWSIGIVYPGISHLQPLQAVQTKHWIWEIDRDSSPFRSPLGSIDKTITHGYGRQWVARQNFPRHSKTWIWLQRKSTLWSRKCTEYRQKTLIGKTK